MEYQSLDDCTMTQLTVVQNWIRYLVHEMDETDQQVHEAVVTKNSYYSLNILKFRRKAKNAKLCSGPEALNKKTSVNEHRPISGDDSTAWLRGSLTSY